MIHVCLDQFNLIFLNQIGFRKEKLSTTAFYSFFEVLVEGMKAGEYPVAIFCNLSRAVDNVDHNLLQQRLFDIGVQG